MNADDTIEELITPGELIDERYLVREQVGGGANGLIFRAINQDDNTSVALKVLSPEVSQRSSTAMDRFRREMKVIRNLDHPNIISIYDWGRTQHGFIYMVLEFLDGATLEAAVRSGPMSEVEVLETTHQLASALDVAHQSGVVHRDLKPANIMLAPAPGEQWCVKVLDFGLAKVFRRLDDESIQELTRAGTTVGTPRYIAPEQARAETVGPMTDLYAVGLLMYEMCTGVPAVEVETVTAAINAHIRAKPLDLDAIDDVYAEARPIIYKLIEKDPKRRYQSAGELLEALEKWRHQRERPVWDTSKMTVGPALGDVTGDFPGAGGVNNDIRTPDSPARNPTKPDPMADVETQPLEKTSSADEPDSMAAESLQADEVDEPLPPSELELDDRVEPVRGDREERGYDPLEEQRQRSRKQDQRDQWFRPPRSGAQWVEGAVSVVMVPLSLMAVGAQAAQLSLMPRLAVGLSPTVIALGWAFSRSTGEWSASWGRRGWICCMAAVVIAHLLGPTELANELARNPGWFLTPVDGLPGVEIAEHAVMWVSHHWSTIVLSLTGHSPP